MGKAATIGRPGPGGGKPPPGKPGPDAAAAGMDRKALKQELRYAKEGPINVAFAQGADGKAVVQLHRRKPGRALENELRDGAPDARNHRWGTVEVHPDEPKQVVVKVNKSISGMSRRLVLALKGTGISKVRIEPLDGGEPDVHEEPDEEEQGEDVPTAPRSRGAQPPEGAPDGTAADGAGARTSRDADPEAQALKALLVELVGRMLAAIRRDPSQKAALTELATDAQASLKRGELEQAAAGAEILRMALDEVEQASAGGGGRAKQGAGPGDAPAGSGGGAAEAFATSARAWSEARAQVDGQLRKLQAAILSANEGEFGDGLANDFLAAVEPVLATLDDSLSRIFAAAAKAKNPSDGAALRKHARATLVRYAKFVQSDRTIKHLDANPFMELQLGKTLAATLSTLSKSIH